MRRILLIAGALLGGVALVIAGLLVYGAFNLNSIVTHDRQYLLDRMGDSLGRDVQAQNIEIGLGWGVTLEITGVQIADDPAFSQLPFLKAKQMSGQVEVLPMLAGQIVIDRLALLNPSVRILRDQAGRLNVSTLGRRRVAAAAGQAASGPAPEGKHGARAPISVLIQNVSIRNGGVFYQDATVGESPVRAGHLNLDLSDLNPTRPFPIKLQLTVLGGGAPNVALKGMVGPLMSNGTMEPMELPFDLSITAGPVLLDRLRDIAELHNRIPGRLSMPDPIMVKATIKGTPRAVNFVVKTDLSSSRLVYLGLFN